MGGRDTTLAAQLASLKVAHAQAQKSLREAEERLAFLHELATIARVAPDLDALVRASLTVLGQKLEVSRSVYAEIDPDENRVYVTCDFCDGCLSIAGEHHLSDFGSRIAKAIREGKDAFVVNDVSEEFPEVEANVLGSVDLRAAIAVMLVRGGKTRAVISVNHKAPRVWTKHEVTLVQETAERLWAALEQRAAEKKLYDNTAQLRIAGRVAKVGGWKIDLAEGRVQWSEQLFEMHEMPVGAPPSLKDAFETIAPEFRAMADEMVGVALRDGRPFDIELQIVTKTNRRVWVRAIGIAERDPSGKVIAIQGALQDIDERHRLQDQLRQAQKMEAIGRLAGGVAHDFNNLLSVILSYSAYVIEEMPIGDPLRNDLEQIHGAGKRASELTRQLLTFSRQQPMMPRTLDLRVVVGGLEKMLRRLLGKDVLLHVVRPVLLDSVFADQGQIEQVLMNLVVNARDALAANGRITIALSNVMLDEGPHVLLSVKDNGHGMDAATSARVFEPFFTTKEKGKGTGLGLATVYGIVTQSGGQIRLESEPGAGTTFNVYLPRSSAARTTSEFRRSIPPRETETHTTQREHILHVDDEETLVVLTSRILQRLGYRVTSFTDPTEAARAFEAKPEQFNAVVTDIDMPSLNGFELVRRLRKTRSDVPVVITSGAFRAEDLRIAESLDLHALVIKPNTVDELGRVLHEELKASAGKTA